MKKIVLLTAALFTLSGKLFAQNPVEQYAYQPFGTSIAKDFPYGNYDLKELHMTTYDKDPSAHAVVLREFGTVAITSNGNASSLTYEYHVKIKIFDSKAFNKGQIEIPFYVKDNGTYEDIRNSSIQAVCYYTDADGSTHEKDLSQDSIFTIKDNKHWSRIKFNIPEIRKGCIIEYKYRLDSPFLDKLKSWDFQSDIPKIYSEYEVHIPSVFKYNVSLQGILKFTKDSVAVEKDCFESTGLKSDCSVEDYLMTNIPAFKKEPYMISPKNYMSALYFQVTYSTTLHNYVNLNSSTQQDIGDWPAVDKMLKYDDNFGAQLNKKSIFKDRLPQILTGKTDTLEKAKAIYTYIQKNIVFNGIYDVYTDEGVKRAIDKHTGNIADINLALIAALNEAGITSGPVLISTRDNGIVIKSYPALTEFNAVIAATNIGGKTYLLDATDPLLAFGVLPIRDLNDQGRVIPMEFPSYWVDIKTAQRKTDSYLLDLTLADNGKLKGTITHNSIGYEAYEKRKEIKSFKTTNDYINASIKSLPGLNIIKANISNLDTLSGPLIETYEVEIDNTSKNGEQLTFNPFILNRFTDNPFKSATRIYPVDLGMPVANSFTLNLHLPDNYIIENPLQNVSASLSNDGGGLTTNFEANDNTVTYTQEYHFDKPVYSVSEYTDLKDIFDKIVLAEKTGLIIKKK